jgi:hypothetical protein
MAKNEKVEGDLVIPNSKIRSRARWQLSEAHCGRTPALASFPPVFNALSQLAYSHPLRQQIKPSQNDKREGITELKHQHQAIVLTPDLGKDHQ